MYRYTTPTIPITLDTVDFTEVDFFRVTIEKGDIDWTFVIQPDDDAVDEETNTIYLALTQEQTAQLSAGFAKLQVRIKYNSGGVQATNIAKVSINDVLDEVII